jgi:hypothetical protein
MYQAVGRPSLSDPNWTVKIKFRKTDQLAGFTKEALAELILE